MERRLKEVISIKKGKKLEVAKVKKDTSYRLISIGDLRNDDKIVYTNESKGTFVKSNDILIAWDGANAGTIGFGKKGLIGSTIARLRIHDEVECSPQFLGYFLRSKFSYLRKTATGATIPHVSRVALESIKVPNISLLEQEKIASVLDKVNNLIIDRKSCTEQLDIFLKSIFSQMFGVNSDEYKKWRIDPLSHYAKVSSGVTKGKKYKDQNLINIPYLRVANVQDGYFDLKEIKYIAVTESEVKKYSLLAGDLLLTEGGDPDKLGRGSVWENEVSNAIHQNHIFKVRINEDVELNPYYLSGLVGSIYGKKYFLKSAKQTTGIATINSTQLKAFPVIRPPKKLQEKYVEIYKKVSSLKGTYQKSLNELESLYGAISQKAFKGELDLTKIVVPADVNPEDILEPTDYSSRPVMVAKPEPVAYPSNDVVKVPQDSCVTFESFIAKNKGNIFTASTLWSELKQLEGAPEDFSLFKTWVINSFKNKNLKQVYHEFIEEDEAGHKQLNRRIAIEVVQDAS